MDIKHLKENMSRLAPWNWFRKEQEQGQQAMPVHREDDRATGYGAAIPVLQLHRDIDRLFDQAFRSFGLGWPTSTGVEMAPAWQGLLRPAVDIRETDKQYVISLEVPGVEEKDLDVTLDGDLLVVRGEKRHEQEHRSDQYHRVERSYGAFQRVLNLPDDANPEAIHAGFKQGVLTLSIDKRQGQAAPKGRSIPVES